MIGNDPGKQIHLYDLRHKDTVDNKCNVIPHQHGRDKVIRVAQKISNDTGSDARLPFHLKAQFIYGHKSNLHSRKESGECHSYQ